MPSRQAQEVPEGADGEPSTSRECGNGRSTRCGCARETSAREVKVIVYEGDFRECRAGPGGPVSCPAVSAPGPVRPASFGGLTLRTALIGALACAFLGHWSQYAELIIHGTQITLTYPPIGSFLVFLVIYVVCNVGLKAVHGRLALSSSELLVLFTMTVMASGIASIDLAQRLIPMIAGPRYYATDNKPYAEPFLEAIPAWIAPRDATAIRGLFEGSPAGVPWDAWLLPLSLWTGFTLASYLVMLSLVTFFRRQWVEHERLLFPLAVVPWEIMQEARPGRLLNAFFSSRYMWIGLGGAFLLHFYNGLPAYFSSLPEITLVALMGKAVPSYTWGRPWNALGTNYFAFHPLIIGLSFLLTREISFGLWAFHWLGRAEAVLGAALGLDGLTTAVGGQTFPFTGHQSAGAYLAVAAVSIWMARRPLAHLLREGALLHAGGEDEPVSYRFAFWSGIVSLAFMVGWCVCTGMPVVTAIVLLLVAFGYILAMTRLMSEAGMPWTAEPDLRAHDLIRTLWPGRALPLRAWSALALAMPFTHDMRVTPMPRVMQSLKIAGACRAGGRDLSWALLLATIVAIPVSYWSLLNAAYTHGGVAINIYRFINLARAPEQFVGSAFGAASGADWVGMAGVAYGAAKVAGLSWLRTRYPWWPLHPVGYAMSYIVYLPREWLSVFIGWACQTLLLRYGGHRAFRRVRPLFLGMIVGAVLAAGVWLVIDGITGLRDHKLLY